MTRTLAFTLLSGLFLAGCYVHGSGGGAPHGATAYPAAGAQPTAQNVATAQPAQSAPYAQPTATPTAAPTAQPVATPAASQGATAQPTATFVGQAAEPVGVDTQATEGTFAPARLRPGFLPDPTTVQGRSGGNVEASGVSNGCAGWIARQPDHVVELQAAFGFLRMFVESGTDTTLVVRTPSGRFLCNDDTYGVLPALEQRRWEAGRYSVWVGSYERSSTGPYTLSLTELASVTPTQSAAQGSAHDSAEASTSGHTAPSSSDTVYRTCDIFNGQVTSCGGWYRGEAVLYHDGAYRTCDVFNGRVSHCGSWYRGEAPVYQDGAYRLCDIFNGQISHCGSWYRGPAVVARD